ncbi:hypothetical protein NF212_09015 [Parasalinivibrio latis]|uniref:hypothetical protein n=1 Tax=Parasalinivibrio latis TaxID=2952610 RepID=UPI0030E3A82A
MTIIGNNTGNKTGIVVVRIDDSSNPGYANRGNIERTIPPGPFTIQLLMGGIKTPSGRKLQLNSLEQIIIFSARSNPRIEIENVLFSAPVILPAGSKGWDLGPEDSALWPGFESLDLSSRLIRGSLLKAIDRGSKQQAVEGLTSDGIRGIESLTLPVTPGKWHVTLWIRDSGEWEYLPNPLEREIHIEGQQVFHNHLSPLDWIENSYLDGLNDEAKPGQTSWLQFGERAESRVSTVVIVDGNGMQIDIDGEQPEAGFISGVLIEKDGFAVRDQVEAARKSWWENNWKTGLIPVSRAIAPTLTSSRTSLTIAKGTYGSLVFQLDPAGISEPPQVNLMMPTQGRRALPSTLRWGQWHFRRKGLSSTFLEADNTMLRAGVIPGNPHSPRKLHLSLFVPHDAPSGLYRGNLSVMLRDSKLELPISVNVPEISLPPADRPIGVYLEKPPHYSWFPETLTLGEQALECDLSYLSKIGLNGISPPFPTPNSDTEAEKLVSMQRDLIMEGYHPSTLAYTAVKRLVAKQGLEQAAIRLGEIENIFAGKGIPGPLWVTADEPSNPGNHVSLDEMHRYIRTYAPSAKLAGHLNHKGDETFLPMFDLVLINNGYGLNYKRIQTAKKHADVWLYNLKEMRSAAGFFLWRNDADGYVQWHARMPTADPLDPTDGRETDIQFLYPSVIPCSDVPDVHETLFDLTEAVIDLRWILWLELQAEHSAVAGKLLESMRAQIPETWQEMKKIPYSTLDKWRNDIIRLTHTL